MGLNVPDQFVLWIRLAFFQSYVDCASLHACSGPAWRMDQFMFAWAVRYGSSVCLLTSTLIRCHRLTNQPAISATTTDSRLILPSTMKLSTFRLAIDNFLAVARVLVRNSQIVMFDETTSSIDFETDLKVQETILRAFWGKTLLCIAHRLKTIIVYDRILAMDKGMAAEYDDPVTLFDSGGMFYQMRVKSDISRAEICVRRAECMNFEQR